MKGFRSILFLAIFLAVAGIANAIPITTWTDTIDVNHRIWANSTFTFDLFKDSQVTPTPYSPGTDLITSATLEFAILGVNGRSPVSGNVNIGTINIGNLQTGRYSFYIYTHKTIPLSCDVVNNLSTTGMLQVMFDRNAGCQWLDYLTLTAKGYDNSAAPAPVPEPGTLLLLGSGITGLAFYGRRRMKR